jgi:chaperonin GroES
MSKSGLLIAMEEEKTSKAIVHTLGIGDGVAKANLKEGDTVLYNKYAGESYKFEKIEYLLLDVTEITAVLEEE